MSIHVVIDNREEDLWAQLEPYRTAGDEGWWVSRGVLDVGDIAFYAADDAATPLVVFERKTAEDFGASLKDGRYREQRARLLALRGGCGLTAVGYIIEAPHWSPTLSTSWCRGTFNEVNLQQNILRLQLRHTIPVFQASSIKETIQWIRRTAKSLVADPAVFKEGRATTACEAAAVYTEAIHVKKADNVSPERIFLSFLLSIPGMGKIAAAAVAEAVKSSFLTLQTLTEDELSEIKGGKKKLGKTLASAIYKAIHT